MAGKERQSSNKVYRDGHWIWTGVTKKVKNLLGYFEIHSMFRTSVRTRFFSRLVTLLYADTHEGCGSRSMLQAYFARVSTHEGALFAQFAPVACSQIFNLLNIVEHFAGWKFCSRGWSTPRKSLVHTEELCSRSVPLEHAPGAKSLVCDRPL